MELITIRQPSKLDVSAARHFSTLAKDGSLVPVECRFGVMFTGVNDGHKFQDRNSWPNGPVEFERFFGDVTGYFEGALNYVAKAINCQFPRPSLEVIIHSEDNLDKASTGIALTGLPLSRAGKIYLTWRNAEFTLTVLHELVHLFRPPCSGVLAFTEQVKREEKLVETKALELIDELNNVGVA